MAINSVSSNDTNSTAAILASLNLSGNKTETADANSVTAQQSRFLTLLTTQLKNQDPLNPMDNAQMTSQLAQISTVDGIERLNKTLTSLIDNSNASQVTEAAALVGHSVFVPGSSLDVGDSGGMAGYELSGPADTASVEIRDPNGILMRTLKFTGQEAGVQNFIWDGKNEAGVKAADGKYSFTVTATQGTNAVTANRLELAPVTGVIRTGSGANLSVGNLGNFKLSDIKQIF